MNSHSIPCLFRATVITALFQRLVHRFTDSTILLLHPYSFSSCNRYSGVLAWNSYSPFSDSLFETKIACLLPPKNFPSISYPQIKPNRFTFIFFQPKRLRNSSGKGGHLFLPSSSFILSDVSLPLIA
ncbi:hypothetical protein Goari_011037, partial [Gossypium aridum]|nr:hypothetical protein [Gossypium aridum]